MLTWNEYVVKKGQNLVNVVKECPLTPCSHSASKKINLLTNQILFCDAFFKNLMYATGALNRISWYTIRLCLSVAKTYPITIRISISLKVNTFCSVPLSYYVLHTSQNSFNKWIKISSLEITCYLPGQFSLSGQNFLALGSSNSEGAW